MMGNPGSDSWIWLAVPPVMFVLAAGHWLLWRLSREGRKRAAFAFGAFIAVATALSAGVLMVSLEWLPWSPEGLNLNDPNAGIWPGLRFLIVNAVILLAGGLVLAAVAMGFGKLSGSGATREQE
ncbi:hypothetical protein [Tabrizicola sp.]|uniref:hypothetical protein n=1 Tax=Tabrizicola sp. TaxID=2005166 RepID=UPI003F3A3B31